MRAASLATFYGVAVLLVTVSISSQTAAWSNGGYSADPTHPDYGTHDWIAQHALDWLPATEKGYIVDNLAAYLYGTELPDNGGASDGIGDQTKHHVYYYSGGGLQDDVSAVRASQEFETAKSYLTASNPYMAAKTAGIMSHYIADVGVFGHVMGSSTDWGAELHHSDYENYVTARMTSYTSSIFDPYLVFDGTLETLSAYSATLRVARATTFGDSAGTQSCVWMDTNYDWSNPTFKNSAGASLNRAVNALADALHALAVEAGLSEPSPDTTLPTVTITSPNDGVTLTSTLVTVTGTASDNVGVQKVQVSRDAINWVVSTGSTSWSATLTLIEGQNTIYARATDTSGNAAVVTISVMVRSPGPSPDTIVPMVAITSPRDGDTLTSAVVTVTGTASDNVGLQKVHVSKDETNWVDATGTTSWSAVLGLAEGQNTIYARATDLSGNTATVTITVTVYSAGPGPDVAVPTVAFTSPRDGDTLTSTMVTIVGTAWDNVAVRKVQVSRDAVTWVDCTGTASWSATLTLAEGPNTIYARATDTSGNTATITISVTVRTATTGPKSSPQGLDLMALGLISAAIGGVAAIGLGLVLVRRKRRSGGA